MNLNNYEFWRKNKRFLKALGIGFLVAIACAILISILTNFLFSFLSTVYGSNLLYIGAAYLIGESIRRFSHGVGKKFSICAAVFTFLCIFLSEYLIAFGFVFPSVSSLQFLLASLINTNFNNLIRIVWYFVAMSIAYRKAEHA